jgi:hypothetical protein
VYYKYYITPEKEQWIGEWVSTTDDLQPLVEKNPLPLSGTSVSP